MTNYAELTRERLLLEVPHGLESLKIAEHTFHLVQVLERLDVL